MITDKQFLVKENKEEIMNVIESFLIRAKDKGYFNTDKPDSIINRQIILTDKEKAEIISDMIRDFGRYTN